MYFQHVDALMVLGPVGPADSPMSSTPLIRTLSALTPIALISLLLRSQRK